MTSQKYEIISWQGLLNYITKSLVSRGYYFWHLTKLPISKQHKWGQIDEKFIGKYNTNIDKFKRHRKKAKGEANFIYIRWEDYAFVFHTVGEISAEITYDDTFYDIRQDPIFLKISDMTGFVIEINSNGVTSVRLGKDTYQGFKAMLHNTAKRKNPELLKDVFSMINGFPSFSAILKQKYALRDFAVRQAEKNQIFTSSKDGKKRKMRSSDFFVYSKNNTVQVFKTEDNNCSGT